jgi:hypothetical protein
LSSYNLSAAPTVSGLEPLMDLDKPQRGIKLVKTNMPKGSVPSGPDFDRLVV